MSLSTGICLGNVRATHFSIRPGQATSGLVADYPRILHITACALVLVGLRLPHLIPCCTALLLAYRPSRSGRLGAPAAPQRPAALLMYAMKAVKPNAPHTPSDTGCAQPNMLAAGGPSLDELTRSSFGPGGRLLSSRSTRGELMPKLCWWSAKWCRRWVRLS